jgi:hypothetical protein
VNIPTPGQTGTDETVSDQQYLKKVIEGLAKDRAEAVDLLAERLNRSDSSVNNWLSGRPIPDHTARLIRLLWP